LIWSTPHIVEKVEKNKKNELSALAHRKITEIPQA
jgi:hypothetical protein